MRGPISFQAETEEIQDAGDLVYIIIIHVPEATVENGRKLVLGVNQHGGMGSLTAAFFR